MVAKPAISEILAAYTVPSELARLTVLQLKTLCKENKLSGYSKFGKQALSQRLSGATSRAAGGHISNGRRLVCSSFGVGNSFSITLQRVIIYKGHSYNLGRDNKRPHPRTSAGPALSAFASADTSKVATKPRASKSHKATPSSLAIEGSSITEPISASSAQVPINKGGSGPMRHTPPRVTLPTSNSLPRSSASRIPGVRYLASPSLNAQLYETGSSCVTMSAKLSSSQPPCRDAHKRIYQTVECMLQPSKRRSLLPASAPKLPQLIPPFAHPLAPSKRLKPLVGDKSKMQSPSHLPIRLVTERSRYCQCFVFGAPLAGLEFNHFTAVPELSPITMPPTMLRWAMILSRLSDAKDGCRPFVGMPCMDQRCR